MPGDPTVPEHLQVFLPAARLARGYGERLLQGITPEIFARKPVINGAAANLNHGAFNYGHLSLYPMRIFRLLGWDSTPVDVSDEYRELFQADAVCRDDPRGEIYPAMEEITRRYLEGFDFVLQRLPELSAGDLVRENNEERTKGRFPTIGGVVNFLTTAHVYTHLGQVSAWRRCFGLPGVG